MKKIPLLATILVTMLIATSCGDGKKVSSDNPLLAEWDTPFGVPPFDKIKVEHYMPAFHEAVKAHNDEIEQIVSNNAEPDFNNTVVALDNSGQLLERVVNVFSLVGEAETSEAMQAIEAELTPLYSAHNDEIMMNENLFGRIKTVYDKRQSLGLDSIQMRLLDKTYKSFVRSGANLSAEDKAKLKQINQDLSLAVVKFGNNLLAENARYEMVIENEEDLVGLPSSIREAASKEAESRGYEGKWVFTISKPSMLPFLTYSMNEKLREELYKAYIEKCNHDDELDNKAVINDIIRLRTERAHLLGYGSYAEFALDNVMAKTPENVYDLLNELWTPALERAKTELEEMKAIKVKEGGEDKINSWDWWYYAEKLRKEKYDIDSEQLRPYFSLDNVRTGVFGLANRLYGITFRPITAPVYHKDCSVYEVLDKDGSHLGVLYLDFFPRATKRSGAWCGDYVTQGFEDGKRVAPVVTIVCNFTKPTENTPALLDLDETSTFFHEFGHALQSLFSNVTYRGLLGEARDFVELPSQIMENWATEPEMLRSYAIHYQNGSVIPDYLIEKIRRSALFNQGFNTVELLAASLSDMDIHNIKEYEQIDVDEYEKFVLNTKRGLIPEIEPRYHYTYFNHIFGSSGYSAGYYSYTWAEVLDKDAFQAFVETGDIFDRKTADRFRHLLSMGGMVEGMDLYRQFRGGEPSRLPLMRARGLIEDDSTEMTTAADQLENIVAEGGNQ